MVKRLFITLLILCLFSPIECLVGAGEKEAGIFIFTAHAQSVFESEKTIVDIKVDGNERVETEAILGQIKSQKNAPLSKELLKKDVKRLWDLGLLSDIKVDAETTNDGVILTFIVSEKPVISKLILEGNDEISTEDITKVMDIKEFEPLALNKVNSNKKKITDLYREKGFFLSEVEAIVKPDPETPNARIVTYHVNEHAKVIVRRITILGNRQIKDEELKGVIQTREGGWFSFITSSGIFKDEDFQRDLMIIKSYYMNNGFIKISVGEPRITLSPDKKFIYIAIPVTEGEKYSVGEMSYEGDLTDEKGEALFTSEELLKKMELKTGDTFSAMKLNEDLNKRVGRLYRDKGYAYVNIVPQEKIDEEKKIIHFRFIIERGPKVFYERIEITGNYKTRDKVIRRELKIVEGDLTNETDMEISKARVKALGYFEDVEVLTAQGSDEDKMIVTVNVKEKSTGSFNFSAGISSQESFLIQAQVAQDNFLGRGQTLSFMALFSNLRQYYNISFVEPYFLDSNWSFSTSLYNRYENYFDFWRSAIGGRLGFGYPLNYNWRLLGSYSLSYIDAQSASSIPTRMRNLFTSGYSSSVSGAIQYDSRDNRLFPHSGSFHYFMVEEAPSFLGSDNVFTRFTLNTRWFVPIIWDITLKTNAEAGYITSPGMGGAPIYEKYFTGGIYSVRGYQLRSISPKAKIAYDGLDPATPLWDFNIGGDKELVTNIELEFPIVKPIGIYGVIFYDAGNAYAEDEFYFYDKGDNTMRGDVVNRPPLGLFMSIGFGIRWFSPIAPLRFEWGFPLTRRYSTAVPGLHTDSPVLFDFTMGNPF